MTPEGHKSSLRCAIYTRVSSDNGLEQEFNSLDNQREASEAYVKSQAHEGWKLIRERYDDGGFSGGSIERPALQKLLEDVKQGRVDVIVVYKVERATIGHAGLTIELNGASATEGCEKTFHLPWTPPSSQRCREIVQGGGSLQTALRPMRSEARSRFAIGFRNARHWLDQLVSDPAVSIASIAAREAHGTLDPPDPDPRLPGFSVGRDGTPRSVASRIRAQATARPSGRLAQTVDDARSRGP